MPRLNEAFAVKGLRLRSRLVMAPMVTGLAVDGAPSDAQLRWYARRAASGVGLVIVESAAVAPDARLAPIMLGVWDDAQVAGLARLAAAIRETGTPAILQLVHAGARAWREDPSQERIGPSPVALAAGPAPRAMREEEIAGAIAAFAAAARRAKAAGFDGVELHAAHFYLLSEFLSPYTNRRSDRWGGDGERRARLPLEVVRAVRAEVGPEFPLFCRVHGLEAVEGGLSGEDAVEAARALERAGVDVLDVSAIGQSSPATWEGGTYLNASSVAPKGSPAGAYAPHAGRIRAAVRIPVIAVGKLGEPGVAQQVLDRGHADLVAVARQLIADPSAAEKILAGKDAEIARCQECLTCMTSIRKGPVKCAVNRELLHGAGAS